MTIRFSQSVESGTFPMRLPLIPSSVSMEQANKAGMGRTKSSVPVIRRRRFGRVFHPGSWKGPYDAGDGRLSVAAGFKAAAEGMSTDVRNCTFRTSPPPPTSAPPTSTEGSPSRAPPTALGSATRSASSSLAIATRPSTSRTSVSASTATEVSNSGRLPPAARFIKKIESLHRKPAPANLSERTHAQNATETNGRRAP
jgi:hypothetical protein